MIRSRSSPAAKRGSGWVLVGPADFKSVGPGPSVGVVGSTPSRSRRFRLSGTTALIYLAPPPAPREGLTSSRVFQQQPQRLLRAAVLVYLCGGSWQVSPDVFQQLSQLGRQAWDGVLDYRPDDGVADVQVGVSQTISSPYHCAPWNRWIGFSDVIRNMSGSLTDQLYVTQRGVISSLVSDKCGHVQSRRIAHDRLRKVQHVLDIEAPWRSCSRESDMDGVPFNKGAYLHPHFRYGGHVHRPA